MKQGILLVNLGTPDSASVKDVKRYLREFLMDPLVMDFPFLKRYILVNWIIVPSRAPKSAATYEKVWTDEGSPLMFHTQNVGAKLQAYLGQEYVVEIAMRYQNPSIKVGLENLKSKNVEHLKVLPLFPQYAEATNRSVEEKVKVELNNLDYHPELEVVGDFHDNEHFINCFSELGKGYEPQNFDYIIFSFHGLPRRHIKKAVSKGLPDYEKQSYTTAKLIAEKLNLQESDYTICFQSRLGKDPWLEPYTSDVVKKLAKNGKKRVLVFSPAFVCGCLETTYEVEIEYNDEFKSMGGEEFVLVQGLNDNDIWIEALKEIICNNN
ncbi:MAG: ferrochelatase [Bacteroidia bacterium]|nr:ferrochelatase [Bacteroidia bacterium]